MLETMTPIETMPITMVASGGNQVVERDGKTEHPTAHDGWQHNRQRNDVEDLKRLGPQLHCRIVDGPICRGLFKT